MIKIIMFLQKQTTYGKSADIKFDNFRKTENILNRNYQTYG